VPGESLLTVLVYRGGPLARAGHNHVIASRDLEGVIHYAPTEPTRSTLVASLPVARLTVDEPELRAQEGPDFSSEISESAREGTRRNMLGDALLQAGRHPSVLLRSQRLEAVPGGMIAHVRVTVCGRESLLAVPVRYAVDAGELRAEGELTVRQTDLGLEPFSVLMGALQVQDEMKIRFRLVARPPAAPDGRSLTDSLP